MEPKMEELKTHIETNIHQLYGERILKNSGYEKYACVQLDFKCETKRYWNCLYNDIYMEIKKGNLFG